jgi:hypothetical protein
MGTGYPLGAFSPKAGPVSESRLGVPGDDRPGGPAAERLLDETHCVVIRTRQSPENVARLDLVAVGNDAA